MGIDRQRTWEGLEGALGYTPYPGTLNLHLDDPLPHIDEPDATELYIFKCTKAKINGIDCHLCHKKNHAGVQGVFVIAPVKLRDTLNLSNGDRVRVDFQTFMRTTVQRGAVDVLEADD